MCIAPQSMLDSVLQYTAWHESKLFAHGIAPAFLRKFQVPAQIHVRGRFLSFMCSSLSSCSSHLFILLCH